MFCLLKKGLFIVDYLLKKIEVLNVKNEKQVIKIWLRFLIIIFDMVGYIIVVYNGCQYVFVFILDQMVGYKLGEFVLIRIYWGYGLDKKLKR